MAKTPSKPAPKMPMPGMPPQAPAFPPKGGGKKPKC